MLSIRNKLSNTIQTSNENNVIISRLDTLNIRKQSVSFSKLQQEIIITSEENIPYGQSWRSSYQFDNLDNNYLYLINPYAILSTTNAYDFTSELVEFYSYFWWEEYNTKLILKIRADGYLVHSISPLLLAPIYVTVKIKIYNQKLFNTFKYKK
jgi:hypothetical protein